MSSLIHAVGEEFWKVEPLKAYTINYIDTPTVGGSYFTGFLYVILVVLFLFFALKFKSVRKHSLIKAFTLASVVAGILFAFRMDYGWFMLWRDDAVHLVSLGPSERIAFLSPSHTSYHAEQIKEHIPPGRTVRVFSNDQALLFNMCYYLLPVETSDHGAYILVYHDNISFDLRQNALTRENEVIAKEVRPIAQTYDVSLYRIKGAQE